jgi:nucleoside-diphosphate-sugar epimerase
VVGDVSDAGSVDQALKGVQGVVHLAAAFRGVSEEVIHATNHTATAELAKSALRAGVERFVYTSTNLIYGVGPGRPAVETDEPLADRPYPVSKIAGEKALLDLHESEGLPVRIFRLAFVYGDGDPHLAESLRWASVWPLDKRLHLVHHADVAQALLRGLRADSAAGATYNVADDAPVTALELLNLNGAQPASDAASRTNDHPFDGIVDTTKIRTELGFRPIHPSVYAARDAGAW